MYRPVVAFSLVTCLAAVPSLAADTTHLRTIVESGRHPQLNRPDFSGFRHEVARVYEANGWKPLWLREGEPSLQANDMIDALDAADANGLLPADYDARWLASERARLQATPEESGSFDTGLTISLMRFVSDSYRGRVDPRAAGFEFDPPQKHLDLARIVAELSRTDVPQERLAAFEPPFPVYKRLKAALEPLRQQAKDLSLPEIPDLPTLRLGDRNPGVPALHETLTLLGYLPSDASVPDDPELYDGTIAEAVARFQRRHGLEPDGVLGKQSARQLQVPLTYRVKQIELAMERLRWLPYEFSESFVVVNIPEFRLRGYTAADAAPAVSMGVVVGSATDKQTPVLMADMRYVIFRPYWNVPSKITRDELAPSIRKDARYVVRNKYEIVEGTGAEATVLEADPATIAELGRSGLRLRQKPGDNNALGLVKFIFPNPSHVYLHDTPSKTLFRRSRRDFSHGCIRVENPVALARFVLGDGWTDAKIAEAMQSDKDNRRVNLPTPVQVLLYYTTAFVEEDGELFFFDDIYGHDLRLAQLLAKGYRVGP